ncbi:MAG: Fe-S-containing hydro-lyase [Candidatus Tritonobacter lacicola]|nr:Fe-S-containing hydro-lyase [Candidatus Tritonobacter lacicola]
MKTESCKVIRLTAPLAESAARELRAGDRVEITGTIYTARDTAHKMIVEALDRGEDIPIDLKGAVIYYAGPAPTPPGKVIGSVGPTTSGRMDAFTPRLIRLGLRGMIGKGERSREVVDAMVRYGAVYFAAVGGAGALLAQRVRKADVIGYDDLGPEAIRKLEVERFPAIVAIDTQGNNLYHDRRK